MTSPPARRRSRRAREWVDPRAAERERLLRLLLAELRRAAEANDPWYLWIRDRAAGVHRHELRDEHGLTVACPVVGCDAKRGSTEPHVLERGRGRQPAPRPSSDA